MDTDDYINSLIKENSTLKNTVESLKLEIRTQRKEIALLREERRTVINNDLPPGFDPEWNIPDSDSDVAKLGLR
jgi:hypothetical protein